jgi:plasmid stabilization system protein ParE
MSSFSLTNAARADLKSIAVYTQKTWGLSQRRNYIKDLDGNRAMLLHEVFHCRKQVMKVGLLRLSGALHPSLRLAASLCCTGLFNLAL